MQMLSAINAELAKIGYKAVKLPRSNRSNQAVRTNTFEPDCSNRLNQWKPQTQAGRACKAAMIKWAKWPKPVGVTSYQVRGADGRWYSETDGALFDAAVVYQKKLWANPQAYRECIPELN